MIENKNLGIIGGNEEFCMLSKEDLSSVSAGSADFNRPETSSPHGMNPNAGRHGANRPGSPLNKLIENKDK